MTRILIILALMTAACVINAQESSIDSTKEVVKPAFISLYFQSNYSDIDLNLPKSEVTAFFCVQEKNAERKTALAPRFRLGSLEYVNQLEVKSMAEQQISTPKKQSNKSRHRLNE